MFFSKSNLCHLNHAKIVACNCFKVGQPKTVSENSSFCLSKVYFMKVVKPFPKSKIVDQSKFIAFADSKNNVLETKSVTKKQMNKCMAETQDLDRI